MTDDEYKKKVDEFFGGSVKPIFDGFYKWFYDRQAEDAAWKQHFEESKKLSSPRFRDMASTPFPVPKKYHVYYYYEMMHPNHTITRKNFTITSSNTTSGEGNMKEIVNQFFGGAVKPEFEDFYEWFYDKQQDDDQWLKQLNSAQHFNLPKVENTEYVTPFPIPPKYRSYYVISEIIYPNKTSNSSQNPAQSQKIALATDLDKLLDEANMVGNFQEFNQWLNEASPFQKNLLKKACELTLQPSKISNMSTPFPVPQPLRDAFCWAIFHDDTDSNRGDLFYRNELEKFFKKSHLPIHDLFYQWLYDVETDEERAKARQVANESIPLDFAKWMRFTPFPVPAEHLHNFAYINAVESLLNITTKPPLASTKPGTGIPGTKAYIEFTQWVNKVLNNDHQLLAEKIKECQSDLKFNLRKISTPTPFPVPLNHFRFYHWLNAHLDDLKKSTAPRSTSPQSAGSDPADKYPEFMKWLNNLFNHDPAEIARQIRECQADLTFQPKNVPATVPFAVPLNYYRFYHWVNSKLHPEDYVTHEPTATPKPYVFKSETTNTETTWDWGPRTKVYHEFTAWLNKVFSNDPKLIEQKNMECRHDRDFGYNRITDDTTPFPIAIKDFRFYHWLVERIKSGKLNESIPLQTHPNPPSTQAHRQTKSYVQFDYWLNRIFKNDQDLINKKLKECQQDMNFNPNTNTDHTPFPIPLRYYRFYFWLNDKLKSGALTTSSNDPYKLPQTEPEPQEDFDEDKSVPPTTPSYQKFTDWLNEVLDHKQELITQKMKECQHDRDFKPRDIKESPPFPVPIRYYRFYHWLKDKVKAGEHKKAGIIHTAPAKSHATTGKPGVSFMSTQAFPEYTKWLFNMFKNDQNQIREKIKECQRDPSFNPRAIKVSTPFPVPIRHYRLFHWMNAKLNPDAYKFSPAEITRPPPMKLDVTYDPLTTDPDMETTKVEETTTDAPVPPTKSYLEFTKWVNEILDHNAELIVKKMKECQHDREFDPRGIKNTTPFPVPIHQFRFYHWLNAKHKAGEHKKQGIIHTAPVESHATTGRPGVSFMSTRSFPEYTQWLFDHFKNDQKLVNEKLKQCQQDQSFKLRETNVTTPFPLPIRHYRFFHWMNSKLKSQQPSKKITSINRLSTLKNDNCTTRQQGLNRDQLKYVKNVVNNRRLTQLGPATSSTNQENTFKNGNPLNSWSLKWRPLFKNTMRSQTTNKIPK